MCPPSLVADRTSPHRIVRTVRARKGVTVSTRIEPPVACSRRSSTTDLEQLQAECFELIDHAVQGGLVGE